MGIRIESFTFSNPEFRKKIRAFVAFHRKLYAGHPFYIPILDYEYLGFRLIGITGFLEPRHLFYKHAEIRFFMAEDGGEIVGRCAAFVNHHHNQKWRDKVGFFGLLEMQEDPEIAKKLLVEAANWLKSKGMTEIRGPQNFPVNEATPGMLTEGFESRPVIYYHYNPPYYPRILESLGFQPIKRVKSWEVEVQRPMEEKLERLANLLLKKYPITIEHWHEKPFSVRQEEMLDIYNDAWEHNFGFVPFTRDEFFQIIKDMQLIMDKRLFLFVYVDGEPAAFFGGVPNINEHLQWLKNYPSLELARAIRLVLLGKHTRGFRLGYLGVKQKFQGLGLPAVMLWKQKLISQAAGYEYCDIGWVLEDNQRVIQMVDLMQAKLSKVYTIYQASVDHFVG